MKAMLNSSLFVLFVALGYCLNYRNPDSVNKDILHKVTWYNLLLVILFEFWNSGFEATYTYLIAVGFTIHIVPISIALLFKNSTSHWKKYFLAYSTFGGGNRGVLALTLIAPTMLPHFFILDIGIFLSLLLIYPVASRILANSYNEVKSLVSVNLFLPVIVTSSLIVLGVQLNYLSIAGNFPSTIFPYLKMSLMLLVSLYLGTSLTFSLSSTVSDIIKALFVRVAGMFIPTAILCYIFLTETEFKLAITLVGLAVFLPISSLSPQLTYSATLREWVAGQVLVSSVFYVLILTFASITQMI